MENIPDNIDMETYEILQELNDMDEDTVAFILTLRTNIMRLGECSRRGIMGNADYYKNPYHVTQLIGTINVARKDVRILCEMLTTEVHMQEPWNTLFVFEPEVTIEEVKDEIDQVHRHFDDFISMSFMGLVHDIDMLPRFAVMYSKLAGMIEKLCGMYVAVSREHEMLTSRFFSPAQPFE